MTNNNKNTNNQNDNVNFLTAIQSMFNQTGIGQDLMSALREADKIVAKKKDNKK